MVTFCVFQKLLKVSHISSDGMVYSQTRSSFHLLKAATIAQQLDTVKLLLTDYSMDPYLMNINDDRPLPYVWYTFICMLHNPLS